MTQHTPGPWYRDGYTDDVVGSAIIRDATGFQVALTRHWGINETEANARLIAAAPDLLEACRALVAYLSPLCEEFLDGSDEHAEAYNACQAAHEAIAKATGENLQKTT